MPISDHCHRDLVAIDQGAQLTALAGAMRSGITREVGSRPALTPLTTRPVFLPVGTPGMQ